MFRRKNVITVAIRREINSYMLNIVLSINGIAKITMLSFEITFKCSIL